MLRGLTASEFADWRYYEELEPFGELRDDYRAASIVAALLNTHRGRRKAYTLEQCMLKFGAAAATKAKTPEEARAEVRRTMDMLMLIFNDQPPANGKRAVRNE